MKINGENETLEELLNSHKISQKTYDRVIVAKEYIEKKYNLKSIINTQWNEVMEKIDKMDISEKDKIKLKQEINHLETKKIRKNREKQTIHEYESLAIIGRGAFGEVHVCREIKTGDIVAIKKMKKEVLTQKNQVIHIRNEQLFMSKVKSPWIVELKASFQEDDYLYLVMEFLPGGDLMNLLIKKDILTEEEARFYIAELILAVDSIHKLDCIHRDIKPDNILIDKNGHIKLSDFGLAKISDKLYENNKAQHFNKNKLTHQKNYSCVGTAYYVAPEVLNKTGYGKDIDWWSVGVIFFEMLVGYAPFCSEETKEVCFKVINWQKYLKIPDEIKISKEAEDLISKMINNSDKRLGKNGIEEIKKHPFFKGVDWDNIRNTKAPFIPDIKNDYDTKYFEPFSVEEPFYPPEKRFKKRKDIEFLGYTYKNDSDLKQNKEENELQEEYKKIFSKYKEKEKDRSFISRSKDKKDKNNNQINLHKINYYNNTNSNETKYIKLNNKKIIASKINNQNNIKIGAVSNRTKGNSPPLFSKMNLNRSKLSNQQPQKPLKMIKITNKRNDKLDPNMNKLNDNNKKRYTNKMNISLSNNKKKNGISLIQRDRSVDESKNNSSKGLIKSKMINGINANKKIKVPNIKKATSVKNVKNNNMLKIQEDRNYKDLIKNDKK